MELPLVWQISLASVTSSCQRASFVIPFSILIPYRDTGVFLGESENLKNYFVTKLTPKIDLQISEQNRKRPYKHRISETFQIRRKSDLKVLSLLTRTNKNLVSAPSEEESWN